jgi:hypothetical protein
MHDSANASVEPVSARPPLTERAVTAAARLAGITIPAQDMELLLRSLQRYDDLTRPLRHLDLEGVAPAVSTDPRVEW